MKSVYVKPSTKVSVSRLRATILAGSNFLEETNLPVSKEELPDFEGFDAKKRSMSNCD